MKSIPILLIFSRILIGIVIGILGYLQLANYQEWIVALMIFGLVTDVFDGIIARKLNVATEQLRIWDSNVDVFFWLVVIGTTFYLNLDFVWSNSYWIGSVFALELLAYIVSYTRFKKSIATHTIFAKIWTISLMIFLIDLVLCESSAFYFFLCIGLGIVSRMEIILILVRLRKWTSDVPSLLVVDKINKGIPFKKNRLFN